MSALATPAGEHLCRGQGGAAGGAERVHRGHVRAAAHGEAGEKGRDHSIQAGPVAVLARGEVPEHVPYRPPGAPGCSVPAGFAEAALQAELEAQRQAVVDLKKSLEEREEELAPAREGNRRLMTSSTDPADEPQVQPRPVPASDHSVDAGDVQGTAAIPKESPGERTFSERRSRHGK